MVDLILKNMIRFIGQITKKKTSFKRFSHIKPNSYLLEIESFISNIKNNNKISPSAEDGLEIMKMIEFIYSK